MRLFQLLCLSAVLLLLLMPHPNSSQANPDLALDDVIALPVSYPNSPAPLPPTPSPASTSPVPLSTTEILNRPLSETEPNVAAPREDQPKDTPIDRETSVPPPEEGKACFYFVSKGSNYHPKNESFTFPRAIIEQAMKGSAAEAALTALQEAKLRSAFGNNLGNANNLLPGGAQFPPSSSLPAGFDNIKNPVNGLGNINGNYLRNPAGNSIAFATSSSYPGSPGDGNKAALKNLLGALNPGIMQNGNGFSLNPPTTQNSQNFDQNFDQLFPSGNSNQRFPQASFFSPQRFGNRQPNRAASSPFGFYGFQGMGPLDSAQAGKGNDVIYRIQNDGDGKPSPFDGVNPFNIGNQFPIRRRKKRQTAPSTADPCRSEPMVLREYENYGDRCFVILPELQQITFVTCSDAECFHCGSPSQGTNRCVAETRGVAVWSYCEKGPTEKTANIDFIDIPFMCSCKTISC